MLAIFDHTNSPFYGGYSGVGSAVRNLLSGFREIEYPHIVVRRDLSHSLLANITQNRFLLEQWDLLRIASRNDIDAVLFPNYFLPPVRPARLRINVVVSDILHADCPTSSRHLRRSWLQTNHERLRRADANVIFVSEFSRNRFLERIGPSDTARYHVVPDSIDEDAFAFRTGEPPSGKPRIVSVSSYYPHKNIETFIRIAARLKDVANFEILGLAPTPSQLTRLIELNPDLRDLMKYVTFAGFLPQNQLIDAIASSRILIHPSRYEGFGMTPVEAVALGVPAIVSDLPSLRESLSGRAIFVKEPDNVDEWACRIMEVLNSPPSPETRKSWSHDVISAYGREPVARRFEQILRQS